MTRVSRTASFLSNMKSSTSSSSRLLHPGYPVLEFGNNAVITAKYTWLNMLPKAVYNQFRRFSNFYFLIVAAISFIPNISPSSPVTTTLPLLVVVGFGLARDVFEDFSRKRADRASNSRPIVIRKRISVANERLRARTLTPNESISQFFTEEPKLATDDHLVVQSQDIYIGDVILIREGDQVPADTLLLASSRPSGECFVSTANLDGESTLKRRYVPSALRSVIQSFDDLKTFSASLSIAQPDPSLYGFEASLSSTALPAPISLDDTNLLLRGSILRNTDFVYAVAVYNGAETKIALNMRNPPSKLGGMERMMNRVVIALFSALMVITLIVAAIAGVWQGQYGEDQWYMGDNRLLSSRTVFFRSVGTFIILFHTFVPVSLFVTLEFVRLIQGLFISFDPLMKTKDVPVESKANNLNETLGYVQHIFSDKTGTLTENEMRFVSCRAGDNTYDVDSKSLERAVQRKNPPALQLVRAMALTHDVFPKFSHHGPTAERYQGESPDEVALVDGAAEVGFQLTYRSEGEMSIKGPHQSEQEKYEILAMLGFSSDRKRMSIILRCPDSRVRLYTKGADSVMTTLLSGDNVIAHVEESTKVFSSSGLRTLVYGERLISDQEWKNWRKEYDRACNAMTNRAELKEEAATKIERDLSLVGITAVEDKLQRNVPEAIQFFREAGIRIWVLTGDKVETAENIGYSSKLLDSNMTVLIARHKSKESFEDFLRDALKTNNITPSTNDTPQNSKMALLKQRMSSRGSASTVPEEARKDLAIIIEGSTLEFVEGTETERLFVDVALQCATLICARVTPLQKASVVKLVRKHVHSNTLAIGDGGNDVSMIQEAHIGVGIKGKEGTQAARAADFTMGEFRHLARLLAIHGRFSYIRAAGVINLSLYKNVFFSMIQILFQFYCFASGTTFHNQWIVTMWNSVLTLMPPFFFGLCERDLEERTVFRFPSIYRSNWRHRLFSIRSVMEFTIAYSIWHGIVVFFLSYLVLGYDTRINFQSGQDGGFYWTGLGVSVMTVCVALFKFLLSSHLWTSLVLIGVGLSFILLWIVILLFPVLFHEIALEGVLSKLMGSAVFHVLWPVVFVTAFLPDFLVLLKRMRKETMVGKLQMLEVQEARRSTRGRGRSNI